MYISLVQITRMRFLLKWKKKIALEGEEALRFSQAKPNKRKVAETQRDAHDDVVACRNDVAHSLYEKDGFVITCNYGL